MADTGSPMSVTQPAPERHRTLGRGLLPLLLAVGPACGGGAAKEPGSVQAAVDELVQVVPGSGLPAALVTQDANNNLDVIEHDGVYFLVFRTAPSHFASPLAELHLLRSADQVTWTEELSVHLGTDLREPRLLSFEGQLILYFAELGDDPLAFEPAGTWVSVRETDGTWSSPARSSFEPDFIPWRIHTHDGVPELTGYTGGDDIYEPAPDSGGEPIAPHISVYYLRSTDGLSWTAVDPDHPVVEEGGGSETDLAHLDDGSIVAVTRNEPGDELGWGSRICTAPADALGEWDCVGDPKKYDSPLVFRTNNHVYLIGRRNVTETGNYDLGYRDLSAQEQTIQYQAAYWGTPKRCALWEVQPEARRVDFILDLPSKGDTCFASILDEGLVEGGRGHQYRVYNYSSPVDGPDVSWVEGQTGQTFIYSQRLVVPE